MTSIGEIGLIGLVISDLQELHSWCGETHIQKTAYVAKATRHVPFKSEFVLYKHRPYSFDMSNALLQMRAQKIITATPQGGYGSSFSLNDSIWPAVRRAAEPTLEAHGEKIRFVCSKFARKKVAELERIATAIYVHYNFGDLVPSQQHAKLNELKPHISIPEARVAFEDARVFLEPARS